MNRNTKCTLIFINLASYRLLKNIFDRFVFYKIMGTVCEKSIQILFYPLYKKLVPKFLHYHVGTNRDKPAPNLHADNRGLRHMYEWRSLYHIIVPKLGHYQLCLFLLLASAMRASLGYGGHIKTFVNCAGGMERFTSNLEKYRAKAYKLSRSKHFRFGAPFLIFVVGGSFVLEQFAKVRYEFTSVNPFELPVESRAGKGVNVNMEEEYVKMMSKYNIDNWENKRIPRPWEEGPTSSS